MNRETSSDEGSKTRVAFYLRLLCWAFLVFTAASPARAEEGRQRVIVCDFEDAGTWRTLAASGFKPDAWFAIGACLAGSTEESCHEQYVGQLKFAFDSASSGPYRAEYVRQKVSLVSGTLDGIEFDADANNLPVSLAFILGDSAGKHFETKPVSLSGGWKLYRVDLNANTLPGLAACQFPAHLEQIVLFASQPCEGSIFLDDIALTGHFAPHDQVTIFPVAAGLSLPPDKAATLTYRLRNALSAPLPVTTHVAVRNFGGTVVFEGQRPDTIPAQGQTLATFSLPPLPIDSYAASVTVDSGTFQVPYDDPFGVFRPNGQRLNHRGMWFGVNSVATWSGDAKVAQHLDWMRQLGIDLDRIELTDTRFESRSEFFTTGPWRRLFVAYAQAGIGIDLLYDGTPPWTQGSSPDGRAVPGDEAAYTRQVRNLGTFLQDFPGIRYLEFWNEPDSGTSPQAGFFHGDLDGFLKMFHLFSAAIRATDPGIKITNAGLCVLHPHERPGFSEGVIKRGAPDYDIAAFHAHGPVGNYEERELLVEKWMNEAGIHKPICNTETGERSGYDAAGREDQAVTLVKKIVYAKSRPATEFYSWFTLQDYWDMDPKADDSFGLVTSDNRPKPSFLAYNELIRELAGTSPAGDARIDDRIAAYAFRRDNGATVYACWAKPQGSGSLLWLRSAQPITRTNLFGAAETLPSISGQTPVSLGATPFYLETAAGAPPPLAVAPGDGFLELAGPIRVDIGQPASFSLRVKNPTLAELAGDLAVENIQGEKLWGQAISLQAAQDSTYLVSLPEKADTSHCRISFQAGSGQKLSLALDVISSYPIRRAPGNPMDAVEEKFVQALPTLTLDKQQDVFELAFDPAIPPWKGPADLSMVTRACHDNGGIYFRFDVTDDKQVQDSTPDMLWRGDSVQLALAGTDQKRYTILSFGLLKQGPVSWCSGSPSATLLGAWQVPLKIERRGLLTRYEVYIPFGKIGLKYQGKPLPIRFSFLVNENDGQGRVRWMHWHEGIGRGENLSQLGDGTLQ